MAYTFIRLLKALFGLVWDVKKPPAELLPGTLTPEPAAAEPPVAVEATPSHST